MIYGGDSSLDFTDAELIQFAHTAKVGDLWEKPPKLEAGFHLASAAAINVGALPPPKKGFVVPWTVIQDWALVQIDPPKKEQVISTFRIVTTAQVEVGISAKATLVLKDGLGADIEAKVASAFSSYVYPDSGDVDKFVLRCLGEIPEVGPYDFAVYRSFEVSVLADRVIDDSRLNTARDRLGEKYKLKLIGDAQDLDVLQPRAPHPNEVEGTDPKKAAERVADQYKGESGCDGFKRQTKEIKRIDSIPATRTEWGWHTVKVGCWSLDLYYPEFQVRAQDLVAELYWTVPQDAGQYAEKIIVDCATSAVTAEIVLRILFADFSTALTQFKGLFWKCITEKFNQSVGCLDAGIALVTVFDPSDDWH